MISLINWHNDITCVSYTCCMSNYNTGNIICRCFFGAASAWWWWWWWCVCVCVLPTNPFKWRAQRLYGAIVAIISFGKCVRNQRLNWLKGQCAINLVLSQTRIQSAANPVNKHLRGGQKICTPHKRVDNMQQENERLKFTATENGIVRSI